MRMEFSMEKCVILATKEKTSRNKDLVQKSHEREKQPGSPLVRYLRTFLKWTKELRQMDQRTKKLMMHKASERWHTICYIREITYHMFQEKKKEENPPVLKICVDASIQGLEVYFKKDQRKTNISDNTQKSRKHSFCDDLSHYKQIKQTGAKGE